MLCFQQNKKVASPLKGGASNDSYSNEKRKQMRTYFPAKLNRCLDTGVPSTACDETLATDYLDLLTELQRRFKAAASRATRMSWSKLDVAAFFRTTEWIVGEFRKLRKNGRVLSEPNTKNGRCLSDSVEASVWKFYEDNTVSHCMLGKKDLICGKQKRRMLLRSICSMEKPKPRSTQRVFKFCIFAATVVCASLSTRQADSVRMFLPSKHQAATT